MEKYIVNPVRGTVEVLGVSLNSISFATADGKRGIVMITDAQKPHINIPMDASLVGTDISLEWSESIPGITQYKDSNGEIKTHEKPGIFGVAYSMSALTRNERFDLMTSRAKAIEGVDVDSFAKLKALGLA